MKKITIDIEKFHKKFIEEYNFLYDAHDHVAGFKEAVEAFGTFARANEEFVREFVKYRADYISSDREAAAFMFALEFYSKEENNEQIQG